MSEHQNVTVVSLISFAVGVLVGAMMALLLAPTSGRELRGRIGEEARADWQRAADQLNRTRADTRQAMDSMRQQMEAYDQRVREQISTQMSQLQAKLDKQANVQPNPEQGT